MSFDDRVALIAGGAGAIGTAVARRLVDRGGTVILADLDAEAANHAASLLGDRAIGCTLDVTQEHDWAAAVDLAIGRFRRLDALVIASGYYRPNIPLDELSIDEWRRHLAINADGVFLGCREAVRAMKPRGGGTIVTIASTLAMQANPTGIGYSASKAAVLAVTRAVAKAGGPHNIRANAVLPGPVESPMLAGNVTADMDHDALLALLASRIPLGRLAGVDDVAAMIAYLLSDEAAFITGAAIPIDGGQLA